MAGRNFDPEDSTSALMDSLNAVRSQITWAEDLLSIYDLIRAAYGLYNTADTDLPQVAGLIVKVKDLEKLLTVDLERQMAMCIGRPPYYIAHLSQLMQRVLDAVQSLDADLNQGPRKDWDHLAAEIQATFNEFGFCTTMDAIYSVEDATKKLDQLSHKLDRVDKLMNQGGDPGLALAELHSATADHNGIQQSMTEANISKLQTRFSKLSQRIAMLENNLCGSNFQPGSQVILQYLALQHLLRQPLVNSLSHNDNETIINSHMIHPGTRGWILDRFARWMINNERRVFFLTGRQGSGKTALSASICKLFNHHINACHFFDGSVSGNSLTNRMNGLIQGIAYDLCRTIPEYLNYLDDKFTSQELQTRLNRTWKESYEFLLKEPLQTLYGVGRTANLQEKRKVILIDGLDECNQSEWNDLKSFITLFKKDTAPAFCLFVTIRNKFTGSILPPAAGDEMEGICLEERTWANRHIKDIEIYLSTSLGAILSGEDEKDTPSHAKVDTTTLQNSIDELLKCSAGRFDYAIGLMESFAKEMSATGQFLGSLRKALVPVRRQHGNAFEEKVGNFASPYRSYRDKEGRSVDVRVIRQSVYLMDKTRVALIRGRHRISELQQNGQNGR